MSFTVFRSWRVFRAKHPAARTVARLIKAEHAIRHYVFDAGRFTGRDDGSGLDLPDGDCCGAALARIAGLLGLIKAFPAAAGGCPTPGWIAPLIMEMNATLSFSDAENIVVSIMSANDSGNWPAALSAAVQAIWRGREQFRPGGSPPVLTVGAGPPHQLFHAFLKDFRSSAAVLFRQSVCKNRYLYTVT